MKVWVGKYKFVVFLALFSSSLGVSGEDRTTTCDGVQDQFNSLKNSVNMAVEKLEKKVNDVAGYYMRRKLLLLEEEVKQLKAENKKIVSLTEKVQKLEADNQKILEEQRDLQEKLRILWEPVEKSLFLKELVTSPKARLYSGANFTGDFEDYTFQTASFIGGCHRLGKLGNNVTSVDTFGKCVRLFEHGGCEGESVAVYRGSGNAENAWNPNVTRVRSIGPCLAQEFEDFDFKDGTNQIIVKNSSNPRKYFPDSVQFLSVKKYLKASSVSGSSLSLDKYISGPRNRLEFLRAFIYPKHLNISQPEFEMQNTTDFRSYDKEPGDIVGYGIPPSLGGPVNETYNAFPQTISGNKKWTEMTSEIRPFLEGGGSRVELGLNFAYQDAAKNRPTGFYFWIWYVGGSPLSQISYGRVEN